jgi:hypothetical protein
MIVLFAIQCAAMQHDAAELKSAGVVPGHVALQGTADIPLLRAQPGDRPAVEILINGKGPYLFLVETGAHIVAISSDLAARLELPHRGKSGMDERGYHVDSISLGGVAFEDLNVYAMPAVTGMKIEGVLGLPFFENVLLTIDYPQSRLHLERGSLPAANGKDILELLRVEGFWGLPITLAGQTFTAVLDTQNSGWLNIPPSAAAQLPLSELRVVGKARGAFGETEVKSGRLTGDLTIGSCKFPEPFLGVLELPPSFPNRPNVGNGVLKNFAVTLDQVNGRLRLTHAEPCSIEIPAPRYHAAAAGQ